MICKTRIALVATFAVTATAFQTYRPFVSATVLDELAQDFYGIVEPLITPALTPDDAQSRIALIEVDADTIEALGWPIRREHFRDMFARLQQAGHPWVLSLLHFQSLKGAEAASAGDEDAVLIDAMRAYGRIVGTGLDSAQGAELDDAGERLLAAKSLILRDPAMADELPYMPLQLREDPIFIENEVRFGFPPRFGVAPVVYCMPMFVPDAARRGDLVIPTGALYATSLATGRPVTLEGIGVGWRGVGTQAEADPIVVSEKHCLRHTAYGTDEYLQRRGVLRLSLVEFLHSEALPDLSGRLVVLAGGEGRKYRGPGRGTGDDVVARENTLLARFLDGLFTGATMRHRPIDTSAGGFDPLLMGAMLIGGALLLRRWPMFVLVCLALFVPLAVGLANLVAGRFELPMPALLSGVVDFALAALIYLARSLLRYREILAFNTRLQQACAHVNSLGGLEAVVKNVLRFEVQHAHFLVGDYDREFYELPDDPTELTEHVARVAKRYKFDGSMTDEQNMTVAQTVVLYERRTWSPFNGKTIVSAQTDVQRRGATLGRTKALVRVDDWALKQSRRMLESLGSEIRVHWGRIELLHVQKFTELQRVVAAHELAMGQAVQALMLPKQLKGRLREVEYQVAYRPHGSMAGDWVQTHLPEDARRPAMLAIGDVVGKGASAALITSAIAAAWHQYRAQWATLAADDAEGIVRTLKDLDQMIRQLFGGKQYSTLSLAILGKGRVDLVSLGAPPWIKLTRDGVASTIRARASGPLGLGKELDITIVTVEMAPGDMLLAYSDGVMDGTLARASFKKAFTETVKNGVEPTFETITSLAIEAGNQNVLPDDVSILLLRRDAA